MGADGSLVGEVADVVAETIGIDRQARRLDASTPLFGSMPELDSFGVVELVAALEERFGFRIDDDEFSGEIFDTIGTLAAFVEGKAGARPPVSASGREERAADLAQAE